MLEAEQISLSRQRSEDPMGCVPALGTSGPAEPPRLSDEAEKIDKAVPTAPGPAESPRLTSQLAVVVKTVLGSHFGVGDFTTHFRTYFSGDWDVHWGYDLDFDPWPTLLGKLQYK